MGNNSEPDYPPFKEFSYENITDTYIFDDYDDYISEEFFDENMSDIYNLDDYIFKDIFDDNNNIITLTAITAKNKTISKLNKIFEIKKTNRVGRKRKGDHQKDSKHTKFGDDNITRKVQVHYHNFLVSFINEILVHFGIKKKFLNIDYNKKKDVKRENVENLKSKKIWEILVQNISTKYKKQYTDDKEKNNKLYLKLKNNSKYVSIRKILSETYMNIFLNFYYKNKRDLNEYGLNIKLSNKVETYKNLLENLSKKYINKENEVDKYIAKIKEIVDVIYLNKKAPFMIEK